MEDLRVAAGEIPGLEERAPVDVIHQSGKVDVKGLDAKLGRHGRRVGGVAVPLEGVGAGLVQADHRDAFFLGVLGAQLFVVGRHFRGKRLALAFGEQLGDHANGAGRIGHVDHRLVVVRGDLDGGVSPAGGGATDQERHLKALALHLGGHVAHLFEGRGDEARQADGLRAVLAGGIENLVAGHHHAQVDHVIAVAAQHHADNVLADVVDVALDGGHDDLALAGGAGAQFFGFDVGNEVGHGLLHDAGRLDHLGQEHLAGAKQIAHHVHAGHQRAFDHGQRRLAFGFEPGAHFLGIGDHEIGDALDQRVGEAGLDGLLAPGKVGAGIPGLALLHGLGKIDQRFARTGVAVEHHVLHLVAQLGLEIVIHAEHAGVDDAHAHAGLDGVVQEHSVDRLAHRVVAAEAEAHVGNAAADLGVGQVFANPLHGIDEVHGVVVVFLDAGGDGENVRVEDDVFGRKADADQQLVGLGADFGLARKGVGLALLVEGHDDHRGAVLAAQARLAQELGLAFLHRDGIDDALALDALEAGLDDAPLGRVDHDRHAGDVRLGGDELEELIHRRQRIEHRFVHVDVDDLRAVFHLLASHGQRVVETAFEDHFGEGAGAGDVGALTDVNKQRLGADIEGLQARQAQLFLDARHRARGDQADRVGNRLDVRRRGAAAAANDVHQPGAGPFDDLAGQLLGRFVVARGRQRVGQAGVGVGRDEGVAHVRQLIHVGPQFLGAQRAVEAEADRLRMGERIPEGLGGLAGKGAAGGVGDGAGDHHREATAEVGEELFDGEHRGLGIERVEDGFDQQDVGAAVHQAAGRIVVVVHQRIEADIAKARIVHVRRDRQGAGGRSEHPGAEARLGRIGFGEFVTQLANQPGAFDVDLVGEIGEVVIGLRHAGGVEGAGLDDVGAGFEIGPVNAAHHVGAGEDQQVVVALEVFRMIGKARAAVVGLAKPVLLDHRTHGAIENQDALDEKTVEFGATIGLHDISFDSAGGEQNANGATNPAVGL